MRRQFKTFGDGSLIEYGRGQFDAWCVFLSGPDLPRFAPRDAWYFADLQRLGDKHGRYRLYDDFVRIYDSTCAIPDAGLLALITGLAAGYGEDALQVDRLLSVVYAGMIAEENKTHAPLKKRIKRLGMYQCLIENMAAEDAANFSRHRDWKLIDKECLARGF